MDKMKLKKDLRRLRDSIEDFLDELDLDGEKGAPTPKQPRHESFEEGELGWHKSDKKED